MRILRSIRRIFATFLLNRVLPGTRWFGIKRRLLNAMGHSIGPGTKVVGPVFCTGKLITGENCWIGRNLTIHGDGTVILGNNCDLAPEVLFLTGGHAIGPCHRRAGTGETYEIKVEDGCWIGARATLGKNIILGRGSVVAACACVMADVAPDTLVGGVPAKQIRSLHET